MRKSFISIILCVVCFGMSGCIDIFQNITRDTNGIDYNTIRITVSKTVLAMANSLSNSSDIDYEKLFDESDLNNLDMNDYNQYGATVSKVNDMMDIGYLIEMSINNSDRNTADLINRSNVNFIPKYANNVVSIPIDFLNGNYSSTDDSSMAAAFLATGKYRLLISKKCAPNISKVIIKANNGETEISFLNLYDSYLIEVPLPLLMVSAVDLLIYLM